MGSFVDYDYNLFSGLSNIPTTIVTTTTHTLWVVSIMVCNRGPNPIRLNFKQVEIEGSALKTSVYAATVANLESNYNNGTSGVGATLTNSGVLAPFSIDGVYPPIGSRITVKTQTLTYQNGIYTLTTVGDASTPWVLTRASDFNSITKIKTGDLVTVDNGTVNAGTYWKLGSTVTIIGTSPITFEAYAPIDMFFINEMEIDPYKTENVLLEIGVQHLKYSLTPYRTSSIVCFSNGYTQVFNCKPNFTTLNELPMVSI